MNFNSENQNSEVPFIFVKYYEVIFKVMNDKHLCIINSDYFAWLECIRSLYLCVSHKDKTKTIIDEIASLQTELLMRKNDKSFWINSRVEICKRISKIDCSVMDILGNEYIKKIDSFGSNQGMNALDTLYKL